MTKLNKSVFNLIICAIAALLLIFLFIFPHNLVVSFKDEVSIHIDKIIEAIKQPDWSKADAQLKALTSVYSSNSDVLKLFLNHEDIDLLEASIYGVNRLIEQREDKQVLMELEHIHNIVSYLADIETFSLYNLF